MDAGIASGTSHKPSNRKTRGLELCLTYTPQLPYGQTTSVNNGSVAQTPEAIFEIKTMTACKTWYQHLEGTFG